MNRKNLTTAVLAGLAGAAGIASTAQAVNINPDGLGQVLIYPYYTTNGGNDTLLSVVNTTDNAKAVKVRFSEGQNTREVLDFNLYLSAYDVWTAALTDIGGTPTLLTADTTCTVPYIYGNGGSQEFLPFAMTDGGGMDISRAAEGHFEMIEMGTLVDDTQNSATAATHVDGVPPASGADLEPCGQLVDAWTDPDNTVAGDEGYWLMNPLVDLEAPSGGMFGGAAIIDVQEGYAVSYDAKAINGFSTSVLGGDGLPLHQEPGTSLPSINSGDVLDATVFLDDGTTWASAGLTRGVDAVSFVFMHDSIMNEYTTEGVVDGGTEWVMTFPTKSFYVHQEVSGSSDPIAPFTTEWIGSGDDLDENLVLPCEVVVLDGIWDREEQTPLITVVPGEPVPPIVSPAPPIDPVTPTPIIPFELCYEVSVIEFGAEDGDTSTDILGSTNFHTIDNETDLGFEFGWVRLEMDDYPHDQNEDGAIDDDELMLSRDPLGGLEGLPVTGFAVQRFVNGVLEGGVLANYGGIFQHKATRKVEQASS